MKRFIQLVLASVALTAIVYPVGDYLDKHTAPHCPPGQMWGRVACGYSTLGNNSGH